jgi:hypothetical protein
MPVLREGRVVEFSPFGPKPQRWSGGRPHGGEYPLTSARRPSWEGIMDSRRPRRISRNRQHLHRQPCRRHPSGEKGRAEPAAIIAALKRFGRPLKRIGLEAGPTSSGCTANCAASAIRRSASLTPCGTRRIAMMRVASHSSSGSVGSASPRQKRRGTADTHVAGQPPAASDKAAGSRNSVRGSLKVFGLRVGWSPAGHSRRACWNWSPEDRGLLAIPGPCCACVEP